MERTSAVFVVFVVSAAAFAVGAAPWITWYDSAELATAAFQLAVSHPPGQPLHAILGKAFCLIPFGSEAFRTNLLSAITAAVALAGVAATGRTLQFALAPGASRRARTLAAVGPAIALGLAASLMGQATRSEVYAPAFALTAWGDFFAIRSIANRQTADTRDLATAAFLAGLGASIHPAAGIAVVLCAGWIVIWIAPRTVLRWRTIGWAFFATLLGTLVLAYLPARTGPDVMPTWETLRTWSSFKAYALGEAYRINAQGGLAALSAMGLALRSVVLRTGVLPAALWIAACGWLSVRHARWAAAIFGATLLPVVLLSVSPFEEHNPDLRGYLLPVYALYLASLFPTILATTPERPAIAVAALALLVAAGFGFRRSEWRTAYVLPDLWVDQAMGEPPPKSLVVVESDHVVFGTSYAQIVEGDRPDCGFVTGGFAHLARHIDEAASRRPFPRPVTPSGTGEYRQTIVHGILDSLAKRTTRVVERAVWDPPAARALGIFFTIDPSDPPVGDRRLPGLIERELRRGGGAYADGSDRVVWRIRYERGQSMWGRSRFGAGAKDLLTGLSGATIADDVRRQILSLQDGTPAQPYALTPMMTRPWIADERLLRTELARLLTRAGRPELGIPLLDSEATRKDPEAILLDCELRMAGARACYDRVRRDRPKLGPLVDVGMARVLIREGRLDEARASIDRGKASGDSWATSFATSVEVELTNARATANPPSTSSP